MQLFENIKNQYVGKPHHPHSALIEKGIHALTIKGINDPKVKYPHDRERVSKFLGNMERLVRITDQLDEQLHAGFYFYLLTSQRTFVSNSGFVYPIVLILVGFFIFNLLGYYEHYKIVKDPHLQGTFTFMGLAFGVGFITMITPRLYLENTLTNIRGEYCLSGSKDNVALVTLGVGASLSVALLILFKLAYKKHDDNFWFSLKSHYWWPSLVISGALVVYQFSQSLLCCLVLFPLV